MATRIQKWRALGATLSLAVAVAVPIQRAASAMSTSASGGDDYVTYSGIAVAQHTRHLLYGEKHVLIYREGKIAERVVLYTCRDGSAFARKTVSYDGSLAPNFVLDDASNGMHEGIRGDASGRSVFFRASNAAAEKTGALPQVSGLVADAGFDEFVRVNWQSLLTGNSLSMRFLIPSRVDDLRFRVGHLRSDVLDGKAVEVFRLQLAGALGWILPGIDVYYGAVDRVLMRYVGLSDLRDASQDNMKVDIAFHPRDRTAAGARDIDAARQARIAPCQ